MAVPEFSIAPESTSDAEPAPATAPGPRRPSRLGFVLAACLLIGLYLWRHALPGASPWLDIVALTAAWGFLLAVRAWLKRRRSRP
jgi:hypothetical protein